MRVAAEILLTSEQKSELERLTRGRRREARLGFFRDLTENQLRRGVFTSVEQLQTSIFDYIQQHNCQPKPFIWTAKATDILEKVKRGKATLLNCPSA